MLFIESVLKTEKERANMDIEISSGKSFCVFSLDKAPIYKIDKDIEIMYFSSPVRFIEQP